MADSTVPLAAIGLVGSILALVVTPLFGLLRANTNALSNLVESSEKVAQATTKGAEEAKTRNGHLGDQNMKLAQLVTAQNKDIASIKESSLANAKTNAKTADILSKSALIAAEDRDLLTNGNQVVVRQEVEHQVVKSKE